MPAALRLANAVASIVSILRTSRLREAERRIRLVFGPGMPEGEVRAIAARAFHNLCMGAVEMARMHKLDRAWVEQHVDYSSIKPLIDQYVRPDRGAIIVLPHMGNWDLAGAATRLIGWPMFVITARQRNPLVNQWIARVRGGHGAIVLPREDLPLRQVLRLLRSGHILAILTDLRSNQPGILARFLGGEANVPAGFGLFAHQTGVPVFPGYCVREGRDRHVWHFGEVLYADQSLSREEAGRRITQVVLDRFDAAIRKHPDQFFWFNRRWVLEPLAAAGPVGAPSAGRTAHPGPTPGSPGPAAPAA